MPAFYRRCAGCASCLLDSAPVSPTPYVDHPLASGLRARLSFALLRAAGWSVVLVQPVPAKCVAVVYPHTSNWDFPIGLLTKWVVGIPFRFVGKDSLFVPPFGALFRRWGGIPVNRRESTGFIAQLEAQFAAHDEFHLVIAPEGTRSRAEHWKSGFWHLARAAKVPVALAYFNYARRECGIGGYVTLTDDPRADMARIAAFYSDKTACHPELAGPVRLAE
jgi:1-acyl-sn-glycerol-3-phosphate acyltransferase